MNYSAKRRLDYLCDKEIKRDLVSTMFVLILQIFGRYAELQTHRKKHPPFILQMGHFEKR